MIADDRRSQNVLGSYGNTLLRSSAILIANDRRRQNHVLSPAIVCDCLRSVVIMRSYGNQNSAIYDRNVSYNTMNSISLFNARSFPCQQHGI